jgi:hypothetical protein
MYAEAAGAVIEATGAVVSTTTEVADEEALFPARSKARNVIVWLPSETPVRVNVVVPLGKVVGAAVSTVTSKWSIPEVASEAVHVSWTELVPKIWPEFGAVKVALGGVASTVTETESDAENPAKSNAVTAIVCGPSATPVRRVLVAVPPSTTGGPPSRLTSIRSNPAPESDAVQMTATLRVATKPAAGELSVTVGGIVSTVKLRVAVVECPARSKATRVAEWDPWDRLLKV